MLLVIVGAGASFDSVHQLPPNKYALEPLSFQNQRLNHEAFRPPLAYQLFEDRELFRNFMNTFHQFKALVPRLRSTTVPIEKQLAMFEEQGKDFPLRYQQIAAIRYYSNRCYGIAKWGGQRFTWELRTTERSWTRSSAGARQLRSHVGARDGTIEASGRAPQV
jgi:hypothetical protein